MKEKEQRKEFGAGVDIEEAERRLRGKPFYIAFVTWTG